MTNLDVAIGEIVAFLSRPQIYGDGTTKVDLRETHMSWVFLTDKFAYKLKKQVCFPLLDFTTLAAREHSCREEVRLNRRLAPDIYLGVTAVTLSESGHLALAGKGEIVDWLVKMIRLPEQKILDFRIRQGGIREQQIDQLGQILIGFFRNASPVDVAPDAYVERFATQHDQNRQILEGKPFDLPTDQVDRVLRHIQKILSDRPDWLTEPAKKGHIIDGHGDLRPEHICLSEPPVIIDCLEFAPSLRAVDPFDELAFLALECDLAGAAWVGDRLIERIAQGLGRQPPEQLMAFYTAHKACVRARLALAHLLDSDPREPEKWEPLAVRYLGIAERACVKLPHQGVRQ